jgi:DNA polymerase I
MKGVRVDERRAETVVGELDLGSKMRLKRRFIKLAGFKFNIASPKQLGAILFDQMKLVDKA